MEENNNVNLPEKKGSSTIVLIVVCVVAFAVGFAVSFFTGDKKDKKDTKGTSNEVSNVESNSNETSNEVSNQTSNDISNTPTSNTNTDTNVVSSELEKDIKNKLAIILQADNYKSGKLMKTIGNGGSFQVFENDMPENYKSYLALYSMKPAYEKKITINDVKITDKTATDFLKSNPGKYSFYKSSEFKKLYVKLFGTNPKFVNTTACPAYQYDSKTGDYVSISGCGLEGGRETYLYIDSMTKNNKTVSVKIYVGAIESDLNGTPVVYYNDYLHLENNKKGTKFSTIDESNKKNFKSYNFIFTSDANGNYYFSKVTK